MQKQISYKGTSLSYSYTAAKLIAKRGYKIFEYSTIEQVVSSVGQDTIAVLPFEHLWCDSPDGVALDTLFALANNNSVYINHLVSVPLDYRLFALKKDYYDFRNIQTIRLSAFAHKHCMNNMRASFPLARLHIVSEESVFDNLDAHTCAIASPSSSSKNYSMGALSIVDNLEQTVQYCVLSNKESYKREAESLYISIQTEDLSVDLMSVLGVLTMSNIAVLSINSTADKLILQVKGRIKHKSVQSALQAVEGIANFRILGNV